MTEKPKPWYYNTDAVMFGWLVGYICGLVASVVVK